MGKTLQHYQFEDFYQDLDAIERDWGKLSLLKFYISSPSHRIRQSFALQDFQRHLTTEKWAEHGREHLQKLWVW